jgi:hypothetical protein
VRPIRTRYRIVEAFDISTRWSFNNEYWLKIRVTPGLIDRLKGIAPYHFTVEGRIGMWYYSDPDGPKKSALERGEYLSWSWDNLFDGLVEKAIVEGMVKRLYQKK